jgi:hypothetical protein
VARAPVPTSGEHTGLGHSRGGDVADREDAGEARPQRGRLDRHVAVLGHAAGEDDVGGAVLGHAEEEVEGELGPVVEQGDAALGVERGDPATGDQVDVALGELRFQRRRSLRRRRHRRPQRDREGDPAGVAHPACPQLVVEEQGALARRRRALERRPTDADHRVPLRERRDDLRQPFGAGHRVELVAARRQAGRRVDVVVGAERDDQEVGLVHTGVGRYPSCLGVDRRHRLP